MKPNLAILICFAVGIGLVIINFFINPRNELILMTKDRDEYQKAYSEAVIRLIEMLPKGSVLPVYKTIVLTESRDIDLSDKTLNSKKELPIFWTRGNDKKKTVVNIKNGEMIISKNAEIRQDVKEKAAKGEIQLAEFKESSTSGATVLYPYICNREGFTTMCYEGKEAHDKLDKNIPGVINTSIPNCIVIGKNYGTIKVCDDGKVSYKEREIGTDKEVFEALQSVLHGYKCENVDISQKERNHIINANDVKGERTD